MTPPDDDQIKTSPGEQVATAVAEEETGDQVVVAVGQKDSGVEVQTGG
jgi:hypothetical protein